MKNLVFFLFLGFIVLQSCESVNPISDLSFEKPHLPEESFKYDERSLPIGTSLPNNNIFNCGFGGICGDPTVTTDNTEVNNELATLGRVLFYDPKLSLNNSVSCGSCHHQDKAFTDGTQFSLGFEGRKTLRNTMGIINPSLQRSLFWDSRSFSISDLSLQPVKNHIEMGMEDIDALVEKLSEVDYYPELFNSAFDNQGLTADRISDAIAEFVKSLTTSESKFDKVRLGEENFTPLEEQGEVVFNTSLCGSCHSGNNFMAADGPFDTYGGGGGQSLKGTTNIGLDLNSADQGLDGRFRIPSLRNIALTGPYMHDGRFQSLEEVIDHYRFGVKSNPELDDKFRDSRGNIKRIEMSEAEKVALIAFLHTLTDKEFTSLEMYSDPFKS